MRKKITPLNPPHRLANKYRSGRFVMKGKITAHINMAICSKTQNGRFVCISLSFRIKKEINSATPSEIRYSVNSV